MMPMIVAAPEENGTSHRRRTRYSSFPFHVHATNTTVATDAASQMYAAVASIFIRLFLVYSAVLNDATTQAQRPT
jgi:hypothetical protein